MPEVPGEVGGQGNALRYWARAAAHAVCEMGGGLPMTHSHNVIDFALAARKLREKQVADLLSHLEKAQPESFQYLGGGRGMASPSSETGYVAQCWTSLGRQSTWVSRAFFFRTTAGIVTPAALKPVSNTVLTDAESNPSSLALGG